MIEAVANAFPDIARYTVHQIGSQIPPDDVSAKGQRQAGPVHPPFSEIDHLVKSQFSIRQLAFMNQQPRFELSPLHVFKNAIERRDFVFHVRLEKTKRE